MIIKTFPTIKDAWEGAYFGMLRDEPGAIDYFQRNIIHSFSNHLLARSGVMDFDLGSIGLTPTKWTKFTGQYVDVESLHAWVNNAMNVRTYDALWTFKIVPPNFTGKKAVHQWGNCLLGFSFRRQPKPSTLTLYTRAQSLGFSGVADYALASFVIRKLAERLGVEPSSIRFQVLCPNFIIKMVEVPHVLQQRGLLQEFLDKGNRISDSLAYYIQYMNRPEEDIRWRAARRMRKKLENAKIESYRSYPVEDLVLRGWDQETRVGRRLSARQASELVLTGQHRRVRETAEGVILEADGMPV
jgi:hypothetical protein